MTPVFKVSFNILTKRYRLPGQPADPPKPVFSDTAPVVGTFVGWLDDDNPVLKRPVLKLVSGSAELSETLRANDAEAAIEIVRDNIVGGFHVYCPAEDESGGTWYCDVIDEIQIVRVEPVTFLTID